MGFIKRTSLLIFFTLGVVAYASIPLPHPSQLPLVTAVPIPVPIPYFPDLTNDVPSISDEPDISTPFVITVSPTPTISSSPTVSPVPSITDEPDISTPFVITVSPTPTISSGVTVSPLPTGTDVPVSPVPTISSGPTVSPTGHPGCGNGCATQSTVPVPSPCAKKVCFEKKQTCCYKHSICATKTKKVQFCKADKAEKCVEKCTKECLKIPKTTMKKKCKKETVYEARKWCKIQWFGMCKPVAVEKEVCCNHPETVYEQVCKDNCNPDCKTVTVYQIITKTFKYETYCAKLSCGRFKDVGNAVKPAPYTSKTLVHKTNGKVVDHKPAGIVQIN